MMRRQHPEDALQIACADYCRAVIHPSVIWHHSVNEGKRGKAAAGLAKAMGQRAGWPDFVFIWDEDDCRPRVGFIELKAPKGRISEVQEEFESQAIEIGADWTLVRSLDDFIAVVKEWGITIKSGIKLTPAHGGVEVMADEVRK